MPSPYRKPQAIRRNGRDDRRELRAPERDAPKVPVPSWPAAVKRWWKEVWAHPVASEWDPVTDAQLVRRLGDMYAAQAAGPLTAAMLAQLVRIETELLLTPAARKRAYVRIPSEPERQADAEAAAAREVAEYRRMTKRHRLVDDDAVELYSDIAPGSMANGAEAQ